MFLVSRSELSIRFFVLVVIEVGYLAAHPSGVRGSDVAAHSPAILFWLTAACVPIGMWFALFTSSPIVWWSKVGMALWAAVNGISVGLGYAALFSTQFGMPRPWWLVAGIGVAGALGQYWITTPSARAIRRMACLIRKGSVAIDVCSTSVE